MNERESEIREQPTPSAEPDCNTPWQAEGNQILDCEGDMVATAVNAQTARLMAVAPRLAALVGELLDWHTHTQDGQRCAWRMERHIHHLYEYCRDALEQAGREPIRPWFQEEGKALKKPETPMEWAHEHLARMTHHQLLLYSTLVLWETTERPRVLTEAQREKAVAHWRNLTWDLLGIKDALKATAKREVPELRTLIAGLKALTPRERQVIKELIHALAQCPDESTSEEEGE